MHVSSGIVTTYFTKARKRPSRQGPGRGKDWDQNWNHRDCEQDNSKKCTHCDRTGHNISECQTKKKDKEDKNKSSTASKVNSGLGGSSKLSN